MRRIFWTFLAICHAEDDRQLATRLAPNLALGQPVVLSTTAQYVSDDGTETWTGDGFRATDGDFGTAFFFGMGCAETQVEPDPWLRVDLGREVPVAVVRIMTRSDSVDTGLGPMDIRLGNAIITWRENLVCAEAVMLDRLRQPNMFNCLAAGRYLWLVLRVSGTKVAPLSVCEVEVTPKGPSGNRHILQTAGGMWPLQLQGVALAPHDRIRIVADTVLCGLAGSATMHADVLALTAPMGQRAHGDSSSETWENIQINRMGIYKVCWCGGDGDCSQDEHFSMHVATLVINGMMLTVVGDGRVPNRTTDMVEGSPGVLSPISDPYGIAISNERMFFTERGSHMLRYLDIEQGRVYRLAGQFFPGSRGDFGSAINAQLSTPMGLALDRDQRSLYVADYGSNRVRKIDLTRDPIHLGIVETVAGNGFSGFSGDGGPAREAQLNGPIGVAVDLNQMLWICDSGNDVLRVVSMDIPVRIPGTNQFQSNVILTAAGGNAGQAQGKGDGGVAWLARMQAPSGVAVSSAFVSNEDGTLPVNVYISESNGQQVRSMSLEFQSYLGVINTLAGSGQRGENIKEAAPLEAPNAELNEPSGVATDSGVVYLSDSGNHRLLMMPSLEYVSMGCWRENIESPWIPSIEGQPLPYGMDYLQGIPENRPAAITACALATLRLGYEVFAIRQMGLCATSKDAHLYFRFEGSSTSCDQGKGGARDNSVYRFARQGMMTQLQGLVYVLAGRENEPGFRGDQGSAWVTQLNRPNGLGVNPVTKDVYVADSGNNRIRLIFSQIGPSGHHSGYCTNGFPCEVKIMGNGLLPGNKLAVVPMEQSCGQPGVMFQMGLATNPTEEIESPSFTQKTYSFGPPSVARTGHYRLCFCVKDAVVFGQITPCGAAEFFIHDAGTVNIVGPDSRIDDAEVVEGMPGRPFALAIFGRELSLFDRVRLVNDSQPCGVPGAEVLAREVQSRDILMGRRYQGNESFSLWLNVTLQASGSFRLCWCQGAKVDGTRLRCEFGEDFRVEAARVNIRGPIQYIGNIQIGSYEEITVKGGQMAGFSASDRIRLVDAATVQCGSPDAQAFSNSIENEDQDLLPARAPHRITADSVTWTNVKVRTSNPLRVCWCGAPEGCSRGEDFVIDAALIAPLGPMTHPRQILEFPTNGTQHNIDFNGIGFNGREYIRVVDDYTACGSRFAEQNSLDVAQLPPNQASQVLNSGRTIRWRNVIFRRPAAYRVCFCYCSITKSTTECCQRGEDFYTDIASIFVAVPRQDGTGPVLQAPVVAPEIIPPLPPPGLWGLFPKDITRRIFVRTKTRGSPAHAGSVGPIQVKVFQVWPSMTDLTTFQLTDLVTGQLQGFQQPVLLDMDSNPAGIEVISHSPDAWYGEWIEVEIEGLGFHRFQMEGWTASPADRQVRYVTQGLRPPPMLPMMMPQPNMELWESHYFVLDACGGCMPGFQCVEEEASIVERLQRESSLGLIFDENGASDPEAARMSVNWARCRPVCGDGYAQPGEQCDDGNLRSLDGCSGRCQVEAGFECANFHNAPSSCWPRLCDADTGRAWNGQKAGLFPLYGEQEFAQMSSLGATCSVSTPLQFKAPKSWPRICFRWPAAEMFPPAGICPADKENATLMSWVFDPVDEATVECQSFTIQYMGHSLQCNFTNTSRMWPPPPTELISTYDDCARMCENDQECMAVMFHVDDPAGGQKCGEDSRLCSAHCHLLDGCDTMPMEGGLADEYHIGLKVQKDASELPGDSICMEVRKPIPVHAYDAGGVTIVQFDSPVQPPPGVGIDQIFSCSHILWATSQAAVGGVGAACRWVTSSVLHVELGPTAVIARPEGYDTMGWLRGDTAELFFDRSKLHPRGMGKDKFANELPVPVTVTGTRVHALDHSPVDMPEVPQIILRGPTDMGGCGDLEVLADTSALSGGRRWKSVVWECLETRPDGSLPQESQDALFSACTSLIDPLLRSRPWCGLGFQQQSVAQTCELRVVIPSSTWCGLSSITLGVTLMRADGYAAYDTWTTRILPLVRIPAAGAVGPSKVHITPQRLEGEPTGRLRLEVASESDAQMIGRCSCNLTRAPNPDGSESRVLVDWYYGEVVNGVMPRHFEMSKITKDESASANVLEILLRGEIMKPGSHWLFSARVAYAVHSSNEGSYVPFHIHVSDLEPPVAHVTGPHRVNNDDCSFALDASNSMARELMYTPERLGRRLQGNQTQVPIMGLQYSWRVRQLALGLDDASVYTVPNVALALIDLEAFSGSQLLVPQAILPEGLFVFTVDVHDSLYPSLISSASATVLVDKKANVPAISVEGPTGTVGPRHSVEAIFKQVGFGACVVPTVDMEGTHARTTILLMRGIMGQPRNYMRAYKELTFTNRIKDMAGGIANSLWLYVEADRADLEKGFIYSYRLLTAGRKKAFELTAYKEELLAAGQDAMTAAGRHLDTEPTTDPVDVGILQVDSEVFNVPWGPTAGSLDVLDPVGRIGIAMSDVFRLQQAWATDNPPLEYTYHYGEVPEERREQFLAELRNFETDIFTDQRLFSLVPHGAMVPLSDWSRSPTLALPLKEGMYVFEGRARDASGVEATRYTVAWSHPAYQREVVTSYDRVTFLLEYMRRSRQAILQVRAFNRGSVSVVPVCAAVFELPSLYDYDFRSMMEWNAASGLPMPNLSQPIYGAPIVSRETRAEVVTYLFDIMGALLDIINALEPDSLGAETTQARRLQEQYFEDTTSNTSTPLHAEVVASALAHLASNLAPIDDPELPVYLGTLTSSLVARIRRSRGDIRKAGNAPQDLVKTLSYLLASVRPINRDRPGIPGFNISEHVQARLSAEIIQTAVALGDVMAAIADPNGPPSAIKQAMPKGEFLNSVDGDLVVTIIKKPLIDIIQSGVRTQPDYQSMLRWIYPQIDVEGLGPPGFMGMTWAGEEGIQASADEVQCQEAQENFLQTITMTVISWPVNPFMYATGSLLNKNGNITVPYTIQLRSCGQPVVVQGQSGKIDLTFRLSPDVVRDRRWGFGDTAPYRVAWWEDIPGISDQAERIRRWTTHGCKTFWSRGQEDIVTAQCDRLPSSQGSVMTVELVPRPNYEVVGVPSRNRNVHNIISYMLVAFLIRWAVLLVWAYHADVSFWPSEKQLLKLLYLPWERKWRERLRRGRLPPPEPITWNILTGDFWFQTKMLWIDRIIWIFCSVKALKGSELFYSVETRELIKMRSGDRDATYERFVDTMNDKDQMDKIQYVKEQRSLAASQSQPDTMNRKAAWQDKGAVEALQDQEVSYRDQQPLASGRSSRMPSHRDPYLDGPPLSQLRGAANNEEQRQIQDAAMRTGDAPGTGPVMPAQGLEEMDAQDKAQAALEAALYTAKVGGLPPGWEEYVSEEHGGRVYYVFSQTGDTTWERPTLLPDGTVQFFPNQDVSNKASRSGSKLPDPRGKGKLGSLRGAAAAAKTKDAEAAAMSPPGTRMDAMHGAAPPGEEDERPPIEREREVPPFRRLPLQREARHGAPEPGASLAGIPGGGSKEEDYGESEAEVRAAVEASLEAARNSQEVMLPSGWELQTTPDGREFYVNLRSNITQWEVPQLPPHWEERFSREAKVYYLSLFDGRTQWEWPTENAAAFQHRLEELPAPSPSGRMLALPGSTQEFRHDEDEDELSQSSEESSLGLALDEVDANDLLAVPPGAENAEMTPRAEEGGGAQPEKWGADKRDAEWISLKRQMASQKKAHDERWLTARHFPGVREFVRKYELANQVNNWDRAVDNVTLKIDNMARQRGQLGVVAELRKEELRQIFPIIQRLQWTKWSGMEIFCHCVIREYPLQNATNNVARPTKFHRTLLHIFRVIASLLGACIMVTFPAPVDEEVEATSTATWDLFTQAVTMPVTGNTILCAFLGILFSSLVKRGILRMFYRYAIPYNQRPTTSVEARRYQLRYWHELAEMGKWTCIIGSILGFGSVVSMCMLTPQPRAAAAFQAFWFSLMATHWIFPLLRGAFCALVLLVARSKATFDGWLTVWPGLMDFEHVGVKTTEFMVWRAQRIVAEEELLLQVYPDLPNIGRKVRDPMEEEEMGGAQDPNQFVASMALEDRR